MTKYYYENFRLVRCDIIFIIVNIKNVRTATPPKAGTPVLGPCHHTEPKRLQTITFQPDAFQPYSLRLDCAAKNRNDAIRDWLYDWNSMTFKYYKKDAKDKFTGTQNKKRFEEIN